MNDKKRFVWLWALAFAIPGGCFLAMVFFLVGASFVDDGGDLIMAFFFGLFLMVGAIGAVVGLIFGLFLGYLTPRKWGGWGAVGAGLLAAVISGLAASAFVIAL